MSSPEIGQTLGAYKIIAHIGAGGMGVVYKAQDTRLGRMVALKVLAQAGGAEDPEATERFHREARTASSLNHPNICTIYNFDEAEGRLFLAMELLEGEPLDRRLGGRPLDLPTVIDFGTQVADALDAAHHEGILHRDIKPANLFLTRRGQIKVLDFGLAKLTAGRGGRAGHRDPHPTEHFTSVAGTTVGTIAYMSPEQARGEDLDPRTDLFSFGVVLYEMATGRVSFPGTTTAVIFDAILNRDPRPASAFNAAVPPELDRIIGKALEKDRTFRYQSAADMRADLQRLRRDASSRRIAVASLNDEEPMTMVIPSGSAVRAMRESGVAPGESGSSDYVHPDDPQTRMPSGSRVAATPAASGVKKGRMHVPGAHASRSGVPPPPSSPAVAAASTDPSSTTKRHFPLVVMAAVALVLIATTGAWYVMGRQTPAAVPDQPTSSATKPLAGNTASAAAIPPVAPAAPPQVAIGAASAAALPTVSATAPLTPPGTAAVRPSAAAARNVGSNVTPTAAAARTAAITANATAAKPIPVPIPAAPVSSAETDARERLEMARAKVASNLLAPALVDLRQIGVDFPGTAAAADAALLAPELLEKLGRIDEAMAAHVEFNRRFASDSRVATSKLRLAEMIMRSRRSDRDAASRALLQDIVNNHPRTAQSLAALQLKIRAEQGVRQRVVDPVLGIPAPVVLSTLRTVTEQFPTAPASMLAFNRLAEIYEDLDQHALAAQTYTSLGINFPANPHDAWFKAGEIYERRVRDREKARAAYANVPATSGRYRDAQRRLNQQ